MSLSLGEKLRQAREEQGITISEIAEQTRISPHYLESIEKNNFKILPGGIFNKGFIKAFARYVGLNEADAVQEYVKAIGETDGPDADEPKPYHPEVLTDDRAGPSMAPTVIFAVIILALMTGGILFLVKYLQKPGPVSNQASLTPPTANTNTSNIANADVTPPAPATDKISIELKAVNEPVWISYAVDSDSKVQTLAPDESLKLDAANSFKLSYSKAKLPNLQVSVNGRSITMPAAQAKGTIEFEVNKSNLNEVLQNGAAAAETRAGTPAASQSPAAAATPKPAPETTPARAPRPTPEKTVQPKPSPTVIVVGNRKPAATPRPN